MAVIHLFGPFSLIYRYYRVSVADYIAFNVAFVSRAPIIYAPLCSRWGRWANSYLVKSIFLGKLLRKFLFSY